MDAFITALVLGILFVSYYYLRVDVQRWFIDFLWYLQLHFPFVAKTVEFITLHTKAADFIGIALFGFLSKLFFLPIPAEPYLLYAYNAGANIILLVTVSALAGVAASLINYFIGFLLGKHVLRRSAFAQKLTGWIEQSNIAPLLIFGAALLPLPDVASLVFGASRVGVKRFAVYTLVGLVVKGYILLLAYDFIAPHLQAAFIFF